MTEMNFMILKHSGRRTMKTTKIMIGRQKLLSISGLSCSYKRKKEEVFNQIPVFMGQSRKNRSAGLGIQAKKCLDNVGADVQMSVFESFSSVRGYSREMLDDRFEFLREKLGKI
jgi:hypothetical protein